MKTKIILSRKGFDSTAGVIHSPIIDGKFFSLPIPEGGSGLFYKDLKLFGNNMDLFSLIRQLGAKQFSECHMDPNLNPSLYGLNEKDGWSPVFGQDDTALKHLLDTNKISVGDIFLFFGRFKYATLKGKKVEYLKSKELHAIYGFLEIGEIVNIGKGLNDEQKEKFNNHPHVKHQEYYHKNSTLFIPASKSIHGLSHTVGTFKFNKELVLSEEEKSLSNWKMPKPFWGKEFTYELKIDKKGIVKSPGRGQEMVGNASEEMISWIRKIVNQNLLQL
jgi:hypothetical protein